MAIFGRELTTYLGAQLGSGWTPATNLFFNTFPYTPKPAIAIYMESGEPADVITDIFTPYIRLLSRAENMTDAIDNYDLAFQILNRLKDTDLTTFHIAYIESLGSVPRPIRDEQQDVILEGNFRVRYKLIES